MLLTTVRGAEASTALVLPNNSSTNNRSRSCRCLNVRPRQVQFSDSGRCIAASRHGGNSLVESPSSIALFRSKASICARQTRRTSCIRRLQPRRGTTRASAAGLEPMVALATNSVRPASYLIPKAACYAVLCTRLAEVYTTRFVPRLTTG